MIYFTNGAEFFSASLAVGSGVSVTGRATAVRGPFAIDVNPENTNWSLFPHGRRFLFIDQGSADGRPRMALVHDWPSLARQAMVRR